MFIGHGFAAAVLTVLVIRVAFPEFRDRETVLAVVAFVFGILPDIDMLHTLLEMFLYLTNNPGLVLSPSTLLDVFWTLSWDVHRGLTHSILVVTVLALFLYRLAQDRRDYDGTIEPRQFTREQFYDLTSAPTRRLLAVLVVLSIFATGVTEFLVFWLFVFATVAVTLVLTNAGVTRPRELLLSALVGMASHPLGDLWLGPSFQIFAPLPYESPRHQPLLGDETLHYTIAYSVEAAICLVGLLVLAASYRNIDISEAAGLVFDPRADARFAIVTAVLVLVLYSPTSYTVLYWTYELTVVAITVPIVLLAIAYYRLAASHTLVSLVYVIFATQILASVALIGAIVVVEVVPIGDVAAEYCFD